MLGRKSVLMGILTSGFVIANASHASTAAAAPVTATGLTGLASAVPAYVPTWEPSTAYAAGQQIISPNNDAVSATVGHTSSPEYVTDTAKWTLSRTYGMVANVAVNVLDNGAVGDGVTDCTQAFLSALATGRPVYVPGGKNTVYMVDELSGGLTDNFVMFGIATLKLRASGPTGIINVTGISGFHLDGLTFDADGKAMAAVRLVGCTDFDLGTTRYTHGTYFGLDLQECVDFRATTLTSDSNGAAGGQVGSGVYLREKTGGTGCKRFDIGSIRGNLNGIGEGLDGDTVHTSGSAATGTIGRVTARNSTRYGAKFQHTGGFVQVGQITASGNERGVSASGCNGLSVGSIHCDANSDIGLWIDAGARNVRIGSATVLNSGGQGCYVSPGASDLTINDLFIRVTDTRMSGGTSGRGFDCRGVTRGKIGNLTIVDAGSGAVNTSDAIYCNASEDLQLSNVTVVDTRAGTARALRVGNFNSCGNNIRITNLRASNCQSSALLNMTAITLRSVSIDGSTADNRGSAIIPAGATSVIVAHKLLAAPTSARVSGSSADTAQAYVAAMTATQLTIRVPVAVAAARTVYWSAETGR